MSDLNGIADTPTSPSRAPYAIEPSDDTDLPEAPKGVYVGTGGDVRLLGVGSDTPVTYKNLPDASYIAVHVQRVYETGTTATDMIAEA